MKPDRDARIRVLAGDYVCGAMTPATRNRFEKLRHTYSELDTAVVQWETALLPLALRLRPVQPPPGILVRILLVLNLPLASPRQFPPTEQVGQNLPGFRLIHHRHRQPQHGGGRLLR